jgi:hypothetical protein
MAGRVSPWPGDTGNGSGSGSFLSQLVSVLFSVGRWDEALTTADEIPPIEDSSAVRYAYVELLMTLPQINVARGNISRAVAAIAPFASFAESADIQERTAYQFARAVVLRAQGDLNGAVMVGREAAETTMRTLGASAPQYKMATVDVMEASLALGDLDALEGCPRRHRIAARRPEDALPRCAGQTVPRSTGGAEERR